MINQKISKILYEMSELLRMEEVPFKPAAYEKAADSVENFDNDLEDVYEAKDLKGLEEIPGVGKGIAERIEEYIKTGHIRDYDKLKEKIPVDISALTAVEGVGPKLIKLFYKELKIKNLRDLEKAARAGKISQLPRCGKKLEEKILKWIGFYRKSLKDSLLEKTLSASKTNKLKLIEERDILGDLHVHSHFNVDRGFVNKMVKKAIEKGYRYIGISDHTKFLRIEHGLNEQELLEQSKQIRELNSKFESQNSKFMILHGCEANIMPDGSIDISDYVLEKLDYVIAGVHSQMKMPKEKMTERIIRAMKNPNVDIISHPTGRILQRRDEYEIDFDKILKVAKETGTILEINANPMRLDLKDTNVRKAKEAGVKMIINTDAHQPEQMDFMKFGVSQARRGWAEKKDIVNAMSLEEIVRLFRSSS